MFVHLDCRCTASVFVRIRCEDSPREACRNAGNLRKGRTEEENERNKHQPLEYDA